jgi:protein-tyrosine-phosphatase
VEPQTIRFLAEKGVDVTHQPSKSVAEVPNLEQVQVIVALCREAEGAFPQKPSKSLGLQWLVPDPSLARGDREELGLEYERAFRTLTTHTRDLVQAILGDDEISYPQHSL